MFKKQHRAWGIMGNIALILAGMFLMSLRDIPAQANVPQAQNWWDVRIWGRATAGPAFQVDQRTGGQIATFKKSGTAQAWIDSSGVLYVGYGKLITTTPTPTPTATPTRTPTPTPTDTPTATATP